MNSTNPKLNWVRLVIIIGSVCAILSIFAFAIISFFFISDNLRAFRPYMEPVGLTFLIAWLGTLTCGVSLRKGHRKIGLTLIAIGISILILSFLIRLLLIGFIFFF
jgi:apolipoprotein N-acyltransferase